MTDPRDVERLDSLEPYLPPGWGSDLTLADELAVYAAQAAASDSIRRSHERRRAAAAGAPRIDNVLVGVLVAALVATTLLCWALHA